MLGKIHIGKNGASTIKVIGVGGGGSNAVNHMYNAGIAEVVFAVCNTDVQALKISPVPIKIQLGATLTGGRGAGNKPETGRMSAVETIDQIDEILKDDTRMVFITAGMGGGTGTGAAPVIAKTARERGILTIGIVTLPFRFEGKRRIDQAIKGIRELQDYVDSLLVINNEKLREMYGNLKISDAFLVADNILTIAARSIAEIITIQGYVNVDFSDIKTVMKDSGLAIMGSATASGEGRAEKAVRNAISSPLLDNNEIAGAKNILLHVSSGTQEVTMDEIGIISDFLQEQAGAQTNIIWGNSINPALGEQLSVTIIATGFKSEVVPDLYVAEHYNRSVYELGKNSDDNQQASGNSKKEKAAMIDNAMTSSQPKTTFTGSDAKIKTDRAETGTEVTKNPAKDESLIKEEKLKKTTDGLNYRKDINEIESIPAYLRKQALKKILEEKANNQELSDRVLHSNDKGQVVIGENPFIGKKKVD
ncbi:MAG: cell division protein FtsZ [Bacteroidia bacterium]|nr:cell division protein FtsZ [Bacteroidia bacterium]